MYGILDMMSFRYSLGLMSWFRHVASRELTMHMFPAASWLPQKKMLYLCKGVLCHCLVLIECLLEVAAYVHHTVYKAHVGPGLEG